MFKKEPEKKNKSKKIQHFLGNFFPSTLVSCGEIMVKQKFKVEFENQELGFFISYYT